MQFQEGGIYHIYNRGNNKQEIFFTDENYFFFIEKMKKYISPDCDILAWCLMPNHFHFLIYANVLTGQLIKKEPIGVCKLSHGLGLMLSSYCKAINKQENRTGNLFQQRTESKAVGDNSNNYAITAFHYIHQNPVKAGLVSKLENWPFSSFKEYTGASQICLCNKRLAVKLLKLNSETIKVDSYAVLRPDILEKIF